MQPPPNASRGRGSSLPLASRCLAPRPPPICRGAASHGLDLPCAITLESSCGRARTIPISREGPLPCSQRSPTNGARSPDARGSISTRLPTGWPRSRDPNGSLGSCTAMPSASGPARVARISSSAKGSKTPSQSERLSRSSTSPPVSPPPISASSFHRRGFSASGSRGTMTMPDAMHP